MELYSQRSEISDSRTRRRSAAGQSKALASKSYRYEDLAARSNGQNRSLPVLNGETTPVFLSNCMRPNWAPTRSLIRLITTRTKK